MRTIKDFTLREIWQKMKRNWSVRYRFVVKNSDTHEEKLTFKLSIRNIFVVTVILAIVLITLTALLIAFTPLRVYVPGYTTPDEYRKYKKLTQKVDQIDQGIAQNEQYLEHLYKILNDEIIVEKGDEKAEKQAEIEIKETERPKELDWLTDETDKILDRKQNTTTIPLTKRANIENFFPLSPAKGFVAKTFNLTQNHTGIDIKNAKNTLVNAIENGVVIFAGFDPAGGNTIIIQHSGNMISKYQRNDVLLKSTGDRVTSGEPIAKMGNTGNEEKGVHLHFELWYNGIAINPSDYLIIKNNN